MGIFRWWKQKRCKYCYVKYYDPKRKGYVRRCAICDEVVPHGR